MIQSLLDVCVREKCVSKVDHCVVLLVCFFVNKRAMTIFCQIWQLVLDKQVFSILFKEIKRSHIKYHSVLPGVVKGTLIFSKMEYDIESLVESLLI